MEFAARYQDGAVAEVRDVLCLIDQASDPLTLAILDPASREIIERWPVAKSYLLHSRSAELRIANTERPDGARLGVRGLVPMRRALDALPHLETHQRSDGFRQLRIIVLATAVLASVIAAYLFGVPLVADRLVGLFPTEWEETVGELADGQVEAALTGGVGYDVCDPNPDSVANRALARFTEATFAGLSSPFSPEVTIVRSGVPNAFALPGGKVYFLSSMIQASRTPDEFAGVLAHELGHVYHRHGMQTLIATSATGLLVGFVLGDLTGLSVAGAIGAALIDNRFSRDAERQADDFAGRAAMKLGFDASGLVNLLDRVAADDAFAQALALFASHPLTSERRQRLHAFVNDTNAAPIFSDAEWQAIKALCPPGPPPMLPPFDNLTGPGR